MGCLLLDDVIFRVGDDTTDEHTGGDDSKISPGDSAQCQKI